MARGSQRPNHQIPVYSHHREKLFNVSASEAESMIAKGQASAKRNRHHVITLLTQVAPPPSPSNSKENPASLTPREGRINAGIEQVSPGYERYIQRVKVPAFDPALSEVRADSLRYATSAELSQLQEQRLPCLKRVLARGIGT